MEYNIMIKSSVKNTSLYRQYLQVNLIQSIKFELISLYGRLILQPKPKLKVNGFNLLHLGCGKNIFEDWVNADFFSNIIKFWKPSGVKSNWMLDLRYPFNCDDNVWDGVFSEHTLEHLYPNQALQLLHELYRTMKPGAWLRLTVPDLKKYVNYYCGERVHEKFNKWETGCEAIRNLTQDHFHLSVWDSELLGKYLEQVGFINVKEVDFMQGTDKLLLKEQLERAWETLYMEAQKPLYSPYK